jgi:hypothetical protein
MGLLVHCSPNFPSVNSKQPQNTPTTRNDLTAKNKERKGGASVSASRLTTYLRLSALMAISTEGNGGNKEGKKPPTILLISPKWSASVPAPGVGFTPFYSSPARGAALRS